MSRKSLNHYPLIEQNNVFHSSKRAVDESEMEAAERRSLRCVWVSGGRALTEQEAAVEIVSEARLLLQEDLAQLGVQWDPGMLPPEAPAVNNPDEHHSEDSSVSDVSSHEVQTENIQGHKEAERVQENDSRRGDRQAEEAKDEEKKGVMQNEKAKGDQGQSKLENNRANQKHRRSESTEPQIAQTDNEVPVETGKRPKKDESENKILMENEPEDQGETRQARGGEGTCKGTISSRPVPERSLTQELADIICSPLPQKMPTPQPSPSPRPPARFRAPTSRVGQHRTPIRASGGDNSTGLAASPSQSGRLMHARVLSKVLHSIQTDKAHVETAQTSHSTPTGVTSVQTVQQENPPGISAPTNAAVQGPLQSPSSASPLISPEAKRRRLDGRGADKFSSPELYGGDEGEEGAEGAVKEGEGSFGDSFELDTQTERIIVEQAPQRGNGNDRGVSWSVETEKKEGENVPVAAAELQNDARPGREEDKCPKFNISLTDSQMELILNTSHPVSDHNHLLYIV